MTLPGFDIGNDLQALSKPAYDQALAGYLDAIQGNPHLRAVYRIGSVGHPGISDLDLVVVVDDVTDPFSLGSLSVRQALPEKTAQYIFAHDVYIFDPASFRKIHTILYAGNLERVFGAPQEIEPLCADQRCILALQILLEFTAPRIAQFKSMMAMGKISLRAILLRVASIAHSLTLLGVVGIDVPQVRAFSQRVAQIRSNPHKYGKKEMAELFLASVREFYRVAQAAAKCFADRFLLYHATIAPNTLFRLNSHQLLLFTETDLLSLPREQIFEPSVVQYPAHALFHFLSATGHESFLGQRAACHLAHAGDLVYALDDTYGKTQGKRLDAISAHLSFLHRNRLDFSMRGNAGFTPSLEGIDAGCFPSATGKSIP